MEEKQRKIINLEIEWHTDMNAEELIINSLDSLAKEVAGIRAEQNRQFKILVKLESSDSITNNRCALTHKVVDEKLEALLDARLKKRAKVTDWKSWAIRTLATIPIAIIVSVIVVFIKGCYT